MNRPWSAPRPARRVAPPMVAPSIATQSIGPPSTAAPLTAAPSPTGKRGGDGDRGRGDRPQAACQQRRWAITLSVAIAAALALPGGVRAATTGTPAPAASDSQGGWPTRPIRMVIPFPAGGATDLLGRTIAQALGAELGQPVIVENRPGAGGTIGSQTVASAAPDGYTLLMATSSTHSIGPVLNPKMPYDAFRDFTPLGSVAEAPSVLVVGRDSPARSAVDLVALLKRQPGKLNFGSSGIGTYPHLAGEMFKWRAGNLFVVHIPYRGTGLVMTDLVSGQIAYLMDSIVSAQSHIKDGKVRPLAVTGQKRSTSLPDVPTFDEIGISGMNFSNWFGLFAPAGLPAPLSSRLNAALNTVVAQPATVERFRSLGAEPRSGTPAQFDRLYRDESDTWKAVIQRAGIKVD